MAKSAEYKPAIQIGGKVASSFHASVGEAQSRLSALGTAAGSIDLASASDMVTDAQSALGRTSNEAAAMVDQMAKASSKTNTSVAQLGEAILTIGATGKTAAGAEPGAGPAGR